MHCVQYVALSRADLQRWQKVRPHLMQDPANPLVLRKNQRASAPISAAMAPMVTGFAALASGGAGKLEDFARVFLEGQADAALAASLFHDKKLTVGEVKRFLIARGIPIRPVGLEEGWDDTH